MRMLVVKPGKRDQEISDYLDFLTFARRLLLRLGLSLGIMSGSWILLSAQAPSIDSLRILLSHQTEAEQVDTYFSLANIQQQADVDSALTYLRLGVQQAQKLGLSDKMLEGYNLIASYWHHRGQPDSGLVWLQHALSMLSDIPSPVRLKTYSHLGSLYIQKSQYQHAGDWHLKALKESEILSDSVGIARSQHNLGRVYHFLEDTVQAINWFHQALQTGRAIGDHVLLPKTLGSLGQMMLSQGKLGEAYAYQKECLFIFEQTGDDFSRSITLLDIGRILHKKGKLDSARMYCDQSLAISRKIQDVMGIIYSASNISSVEGSRENYSEALAYLDTMLRRSQEQSFPFGMKAAYEGLTDIYIMMGNYEKALENHKLRDQWNDSLNNYQYLQQIRELETRYETEKKENEILRLSEIQWKQAIALQEKDTRLQRIISIGAGFGFLLLMLWWLSRTRNRLRQQQQVFEAISETEMQERRRIAQDLHDSVGAMLATLQNRMSMVEVSHPEQKDAWKELQELLKQTSTETRQIAHNMMPESLLRFGLTAALESFIAQLNETHQITIQFFPYGLEERLQTTIELHMYRIIQESLHNILKHAEGATEASLYLTRREQSLSLILEDNGSGFDPVSHQKGLGLSNIQNRVRLLRGSFSIDSRPRQGTTINLHIPISQ